MLLFAVPDTRDCDESGRNSTFAEAQKKADGSKSSEVVGSCQAHTHNSPDNTIFIEQVRRLSQGANDQGYDLFNSHCGANKLSEWQSAHQVNEGIFRDKLANVEDGARPRILSAGHIEVLDEPEYGCIAQALFVEILQEEDKTHLYRGRISFSEFDNHGGGLLSQMVK